MRKIDLSNSTDVHFALVEELKLHPSQFSYDHKSFIDAECWSIDWYNVHFNTSLNGSQIGKLMRLFNISEYMILPSPLSNHDYCITFITQKERKQ